MKSLTELQSQLDEYKGKIYTETPNPEKHFKSVYCPPFNETVCPVCGQEMDETEHGRQYCADCKAKLGD